MTSIVMMRKRWHNLEVFTQKYDFLSYVRVMWLIESNIRAPVLLNLLK